MMAAENFEQLLVSEDNGILTVTINRPEAMNALNSSVLQSLASVLDWIEGKGSAQAPKIHAMIITGAGEKAFVAGADIKGFESLNPQEALEFAAGGQALFMHLERLKIPVIAAVNGFALGGGLELALACDFIYASENAKFGLPECTLGLIPGFGGTVRLPRRIGPARARELAFTGGMISSSEALAIGLVNKVVPQADLMSVANATAKVICSRAPIAIEKIKQSIHQGMNENEEKANQREASLFGELFLTEDTTEGIRAFIEKRKPNFQGK